MGRVQGMILIFPEKFVFRLLPWEDEFKETRRGNESRHQDVEKEDDYTYEYTYT